MVVVALAVAGATALVNAMVTDGWEGVRKRFARCLGRGDEKETEAAAARLEKSQEMLSRLSGTELERAQAEQEIVWRTRLGDLLESPSTRRRICGRWSLRCRRRWSGSAGRVEQHAAAFDQAQQAVQGHGVQNITFGGQGGPGTSHR